MRVGKLWIISLALLVFSFPVPAQSENSRRLFPLPLTELEQVLSRWLVDSDFQVSRSRLETGKILLVASREKGNCQFTLIPHSALATEIQVRCISQKHVNEVTEQQVWTFLTTYMRDNMSEGEDADQDPPIPVLDRRESVVCINATLENEEIQFSGFIFDSEGLIISTAHDLRRVKQITVTLHDGLQLKGELLKRDLYRDLALIGIEVKVNHTVSLLEGRNLLRNSERLYSIGCSGNQEKKIQAAIINGPPRRMNGLPLWQATMTTLPGSSGSPVFDIDGNLVAIVKGRYRGTVSVGFLIPFETILDFLREM